VFEQRNTIFPAASHKTVDGCTFTSPVRILPHMGTILVLLLGSQTHEEGTRHFPYLEEAYSMNATVHSITRAIEATKRLGELPAIPTQDWASSVANALVDLAPELAVGVLIAHLNSGDQAITPISTGIAHAGFAQREPSPQVINQALYLQDKLERLCSLGLELPENAADRGLVAPFSLLHPRWATTPIGRIFASQHFVNPILAVVPITQSVPGFVLIIVLASGQESISSQGSEPTGYVLETLSGLLPLIADKANLALEQVSNPKAWLTDREHEILDQLILGYSVRVIASHLGRSAHTVHDHVKNLHKKLGASSRGELIAKALGYRPSPDAHPTEHQQVRLGANPIILTSSPKLSEFKPVHKSPRPTARPLERPPAQAEP